MLSHSFVSHSTTILTVAYPLSIGILQARILDWVAMASSRGSSQGWDPGLLNCRWIFYCMSQHTGVGSLSLLQGLFPTQELNWGLVHCRQILYQLSYCISSVNCIRNNLLPVIAESTKVWMDAPALETNLGRIKIIP